MLSRLTVAVMLVLFWLPSLRAADGSVTGHLTDPQGRPIIGAKIRLVSGENSSPVGTTSDSAGRFVFSTLTEGAYQLTAAAAGFADLKKVIHVGNGAVLRLDLQFVLLASRTDTVNVTADVKDVDVQSPDPAEKVFASEDLLDANPGRPGGAIP